MPIVLILYILKEFGRSLIPALIIYTFIIFPFYLAGIVREGVGIVTVASVLPLMFPFISGYVMPPALLTGAILCYGRISSSNEYAATQAGGVWPGFVLLPGLLVGILATLGTLYLNDDVLAASTNAITRQLAQGKVDMIEQMLRQRGVVRIGNYHLYRFPPDAKGRQALDMSIYNEVDGDIAATGNARYATLAMRAVAQDHSIKVMPEKDEFGYDRNVVMFDLRNCRVEQFPAGQHDAPPTAEHLEKPLYIDQNARFSITNKRVACWGISQLIRAIKKKKQDIIDHTTAIAKSAAAVVSLEQSIESSLTPDQKILKTQLEQKKADLEKLAPASASAHMRRMELEGDIRTCDRLLHESITSTQQSLLDSLEKERAVPSASQKEIENAHGSLAKYYREFNSRIALSFCCLFFGVIGPLLGLLVAHGEKTVLFVSGFAVTAIYLILFILCRNFSDIGSWVLWIPNGMLVVLMLGLWRKLY